MTLLDTTIDFFGGLIDLGGPVVALLLAMSVIALAAVLVKLWQFQAAGVGRHASLSVALAARGLGETERAALLARKATSHFGPLLADALSTGDAKHQRGLLEARLEERLSSLQTGFRLLDTIAQTAPLLGLFGTVLGMIEAFQGMQAAGAAVDPSALAGGIWVALLTTAVGLGVAMPAAMVLTWLEGRVAREAVFADLMLETALCPQPSPASCATPQATQQSAHA